MRHVDEWDKPAPPVRIHANTYLVGTCGISSILITGSEGHVLIDGGTEQGADLIAANIRALGFRMRTSATSSTATNISTMSAASPGSSS